MKRGIAVGSKRLKKQPHPPRTKRYCVNCERMTFFKYNPNVTHSECLRCGGRYSLRKEPVVKK